MPGLRGYRRVPGASLRYITPSGREISRREYDNRRLRALGFRNRYELEQLRTSRAGRKWGMDLIEAGNRPTFRDWADIKQIRDRRAALKRRHPELDRQALDSRDSGLTAADGPLARILDRTGRRPLSGYAVGSSP